MSTPMTSDEIREAFLSYFESKGHLRVASSSLIPVGDPTLLLTNAGMVQFKPYFSGESTPPNKRLTTAQKSFRTSDIDEVGDATHNTLFEMLGNFSIGDYFKEGAIEFALECLDTVMGLPKERFAATVHEADDDAYELWLKHGIPAERIFRFGDEDNWWGPAGDEGPTGPCAELHYDFGADRGCGQPDCGPNCANVMAATDDPCNRYVEVWNLVFMQFYHNPDGSRTPLPSTGIDTGVGFERLVAVVQGAKDSYDTDLFQPLIARVQELTGKTYGENADTEYAMRVVADHARSATFLIADGVVPGYEGRGYVLRRIVRRAIRHGRRLGLQEAFLGDLARVVAQQMGGTYPELRAHQEFVLTVLRLEEEKFEHTVNTGEGIFRLSLKAWRDEMGEAIETQLDPEFRDAIRQKDVVDIIRRVQAAAEKFMKAPYMMRVLGSGERDSINEAQHAVIGHAEELVHITEEHQKSSDFSQTHDQFLVRLQDELHLLHAAFDEVADQIQGFEAFILWDSYGFPVEETDAMAREAGLPKGVDIDGFEREMMAQRKRARAASRFGGDRAKIHLYESLGVGATAFLGYEWLTAASVVVGLISGDQVVNDAREGDDVEVVLVETPFYPEGGGQVGDAGELVGPKGKMEVRDTQMVMPGMIVHSGVVSQGIVTLGDGVDAYVDGVRREDTARNHTATHLLHAALRQVLGAHVRQAGSLVAPDRLRFDFSHVEAMTDGEIERVQLLVNEKIRQNVGVHRSEDTYTAAVERGALAFFGDKYEDTVRLVEIANGTTFSFEVCGGTHVEHTGTIGAVYVLGESSIGSGMRRIEAVSGRAAERVVRERFNREVRLARRLQATPPEMEDKVQGLLDELDDLKHRNEALERRLSLQAAEGLLKLKQDVDGVSVLAERVAVSSVDSIREMGDWLRNKLGSGVVALGSVVNDQPVLVVMVTSDLVASGLSASEIAKGAAKPIQGGGGGRPDVAQAGGRRADKLDEAIGMVPDLVRAKSAGA